MEKKKKKKKKKKCLSGRYRPDFLSLCQVDFSKVEEQYKLYNISSSINYGQRNLFNTSICTAPKEQIRKGMRSFPSGHSYGIYIYFLFGYYKIENKFKNERFIKIFKFQYKLIYKLLYNI